MIIPTLRADRCLYDCVAALQSQTTSEFSTVIVDNSGEGLVRLHDVADLPVEIIENKANRGFGAAVNQGIAQSTTPFIATLNDDAVPSPGWLEALLRAADERPDAGMFASCVGLAGRQRLDSAGMLLCADGSSKQRGHDRRPDEFKLQEETLCPSGSAALYRRAMLDEIGCFDESFFLYCEDTDLGLRGQWAGWQCVYVPEAAVCHHYSHSSGDASPLKAYYVERNRLAVAVKNFPAERLWRVPWAAIRRYGWHALSLLQGKGKAAEFRREGHNPLHLAYFVLRAHASTLSRLRPLWRERQAIQARAKRTAAEFVEVMDRHAISVREVAAL